MTAFLSIAPKGAAFAILLRMFFVALGTFKPTWVLLMIGASILSMTYGNIVAIAQRNMKRLLAYSGIAQIGNILIGLAAGTKMGNDAILFYLLTYLFANLGAFAVIIAVGQAIGSEEIDDYSGLGRRSPFLAFSMLIFLLSLAGVPPLAGFIGKLYIFVAAVKEGLYTLITVGLINIVISMYYYLIIVKKMYIIEPHDPSPDPRFRSDEGRHLCRSGRHLVYRHLSSTRRRLGRRRHHDVCRPWQLSRPAKHGRRHCGRPLIAHRHVLLKYCLQAQMGQSRVC